MDSFNLLFVIEYFLLFYEEQAICRTCFCTEYDVLSDRIWYDCTLL